MTALAPGEASDRKVALYFGYGDGGHFLRAGEDDYRETLRPSQWYPDIPWGIELMDGTLLQNRRVPDRPDGRVHWTVGGGKSREPDVVWHAFFWWDRSGDKRGASNSGFYVRGFGIGDERAAFEYAKSRWPRIVRRQLLPLVLVGVDGKPSYS